MICLIVIRDQIVDGLNEGAECLAVVLLFEEELPLREYIQEVHQPFAALFAQVLGVWGNVREDCNDRLVDRAQQARAVFDETVHADEDEVGECVYITACAPAADFDQVQLDVHIEGRVQVHGQLAASGDGEEEEDGEVHQVGLCRILLALIHEDDHSE